MTDTPVKNPAERHAALSAIAPLTLVDQIVEAIVEAAATGVFLPGDRVVEADLARRFNVSRVPVREAMRLLESQGILINVPYRGMRLMDVSVERVEKILQVRLALEMVAARHVQQRAAVEPAVLEPLARIVDEMRRAAAAGDAYHVATLDTAFHRRLCELSGNEVLVATWEPLARQLTIVFGLAALQRVLATITGEHEEVLEALRGDDWPALSALMEGHIMDFVRIIDHDDLMTALRERPGH